MTAIRWVEITSAPPCAPDDRQATPQRRSTSWIEGVPGRRLVYGDDIIRLCQPCETGFAGVCDWSRPLLSRLPGLHGISNSCVVPGFSGALDRMPWREGDRLRVPRWPGARACAAPGLDGACRLFPGAGEAVKFLDIQAWLLPRTALSASGVRLAMGAAGISAGVGAADCGTCVLVILCQSSKSRMNLDPERMGFQGQGAPGPGSTCLARGIGNALFKWDMGGGHRHG